MQPSHASHAGIALLSAASLFVACSAPPDATPGTSSTAATGAGAGGSGGDAGAGGSGGSGPTYHDHVAPLLAKHCVACHATGGIGPFPLDNYADVASVVQLVKQVTAARRMPPFPADNSGDCHTFDGARWLSNAELSTLAAWVDSGAPEGMPARAPPKPTPNPGLDSVSATLDLGLEYTPPTTTPDDYRCFLVDPGFATTKYLTGFDVKPGDARVFHHVVVFTPSDEGAVAQAADLDAADPGPGWSCFGGAGVNGPMTLAWAPGVPATHFPKGTGLELPAGRKVVLQMHYNVEQGTFPDRTRIDLELADSVNEVARIEPLVDPNLSLPPKMSDVVSGFPTVIDQKRRVYGVFPHLHLLGKSLELSSAGTKSCALDVPRWDFHWQLFYFYETPLDLLPGDILSLECRYDTLSKNTQTNWGEGTQDEMCETLRCVTKEGPTCAHCAPQLEGNPWPPVNLCPGSDKLFEAVKGCVCDTACKSVCSDSMCTQGWATSDCQACIDASCSAETKACFVDHNSFWPKPTSPKGRSLPRRSMRHRRVARPIAGDVRQPGLGPRHRA
jgi:hypothetical protein